MRKFLGDTYKSFGLLLLVAFVIGIGFLLSSSHSSAASSTTANASVTVGSACTFSGTVSTAHNAEVPNGTNRTDIGSTVLNTICNDNGGFAIYAVGYSSSEYGNNTMINQADSTITFNTGTSTSGNNSNWSMKLTQVTTGTYATTIDNSFNAYHNVPATYTKVAHRDSVTDASSTNPAVGSSISLTYQTYISGTQAAGTYQGKVKFTMVHPSFADSSGCNPNATNISEVLCMQDFSKVSNANRTAIVNSMVPERQYTLKDKRDGKTYTIAKLKSSDLENLTLAWDYISSCWLDGYYSQNACDSSIYSGLPAEWKSFVDSCDIASSDCSMASAPYIYAVWMTQNLDLDLDAGVTYTNEDTDIGYNTSTGTYNTAAWSPSSSTVSAGSGGWTDSSTAPRSYDIGNLYWNGTTVEYDGWDDYYYSCTYNDETQLFENCDITLSPLSTLTSSTGLAQYHLGNYYNWTAAIAMNDSSSTYNTLVEQSICPAGWTLPRIGNGEDSFYALWENYGFNGSRFGQITDLTGDPLYFVLEGNYNQGLLSNIGYDGKLWSSVETFYTTRMAWFVNNGEADASHSNSSSVGMSIRCMARPVADTILQD